MYVASPLSCFRAKHRHCWFFSSLLQHPNTFQFVQEDEAVALVKDAIRAGIFNDLGSGGNVDVCVISKDKSDVKMMRSYEKPNERLFRCVCAPAEDPTFLSSSSLKP